MPEPRIMLFEVASGGHQGHYLHSLISFWGRHALRGQLDVVVPERLLEVHPEVAAVATLHSSDGVNVLPVTDAALAPPAGRLGLLRKGLWEGRLLRRYIEQVRPAHCLAMYFDHVQIALALGLRFPFSVCLSGIYFRPSFHYEDLNGITRSVMEKVLDVRKRMLLSAALRNPHFHTLFCLDPFVPPYVGRLRPGTNAVPLPDGIEPRVPTVTPDETRRMLGIEPDRKLLLLFGALEPRKGVCELLNALAHLPDSVYRQICVVLAGPVGEALKATLSEHIVGATQKGEAQIILQDRFFSDEAAQNLIRAADLVLLPYQKHVGSSAVLVRAAHAGVPVLGQKYGLMGALIRRHNLGDTVDTTDPRAIAGALIRFITEPQQIPFDPAGARHFAQANTVETMAATVFRHLGIYDIPMPYSQRQAVMQ